MRREKDVVGRQLTVGGEEIVDCELKREESLVSEGEGTMESKDFEFW